MYIRTHIYLEESLHIGIYVVIFCCLFSGWTQAELEQLRLCRNRAYYKVNTKRRQHLQASLSTYLHKEWQSQNPTPTNHRYIIT